MPERTVEVRFGRLLYPPSSSRSAFGPITASRFDFVWIERGKAAIVFKKRDGLTCGSEG